MPATSVAVKGKLGIYETLTIGDIDRSLSLLRHRLSTPRAGRFPEYAARIRADVDLLLDERARFTKPT
jgi:hypothetical protein